MNKTTIAVLFVFALGIVGAYFFPQVSTSFGSAAGSTYNTAKTAAVVANLATPGANATSSSILNTDAGARYVTGYRYGCSGVGTSQTAYTGAGLAALTLSIGTTTTAAPATFSSTFPIASSVTIATSTVNNAIASTTSALGNAAVWPANTYMTFSTNATNTAVCTFGVDYLGS